MASELPDGAETGGRAWRFGLGPVPMVVRPAAGLTAVGIGVTLFIAGPPTFLYNPWWSLIGGLLYTLCVVLHEMGHAVVRLRTGSDLLRVEILGMGAVTSSTTRVSRRADAMCTLSGLVVTGSLAAAASLFGLHPSSIIRDVALVTLLANAVTLFENLGPVPGNDSAVLLELANSKESATELDVQRRTAVQARLLLVVVCGLATATLWTFIGTALLRNALTALTVLYGAWAWTQWRPDPRRGSPDTRHKYGGPG